MKVERAEFRYMAGYSLIKWEKVQPDVNLVIGRNGSGKSTLLQALSASLHQLKGIRREGLFTSSEERASVSLSLGTGEELYFPLHEILRRRAEPPKTQHLHVIHWTENRLPKNQIGTGDSNIRQHSVYRYPHTVSMLKEMLHQGGAARAAAREIFTVARSIRGVGDEHQWNWIQSEVERRGPKRARPMSCGQFEALALAKDIVELRAAHDLAPGPVFVIIDNPETYLHPASQGAILELVRQYVPNAQLFVASHSLKLLSRTDARSTFWLRREGADRTGSVDLKCVRDLDDGARGAFFELYGDDISGSVLRLLQTFQSPEYFKFLYDCALPPEVVTRANPSTDRQLVDVCTDIPRTRPLMVLDFGAGHGDLVEALKVKVERADDVCYVAVSRERSTLLNAQIEAALAGGSIAQGSRVVASIEEVESVVDVAVLCNVCHEIEPEELSALLASVICRYIVNGGRIVIAEADTLSVGEAGFVMWTSDDYAAIFEGISGIDVRSRKTTEKDRVPLDVTVICRTGEVGPEWELRRRLRERFVGRIAPKREDLLAEIDRLRKGIATGGDLESLREAIRQRRLAFVVSQVATLCGLERDTARARNKEAADGNAE